VTMCVWRCAGRRSAYSRMIPRHRWAIRIPRLSVRT
jgi:hypothetical protein